MFSGPLWWCSEVSGIASFRCLHHSPAAILLAVLAQAVPARDYLVPAVVELEGVVPHVATAAAMVAVREVIVPEAVPEGVSAGQVLAVVRVPVQMLGHHVGQIPTVAQMLVGLTAEGLVGVPTVGLPVPVGRVALGHDAPVQGVPVRRGVAIHVVRVVAMTEVSREMIATVMIAGRTDATMRAAQHEVVTVAMMAVEETTGVATTGAVMIVVLEHGTSEGMIQNAEAVVGTGEAVTTVAGDSGVLHAPSGRKRHERTTARHASSARRVSRETKLSGVRRRCGHAAVVRRDWVSSRQSAKNISISGSMRGPFAKKLSRQCSVPGLLVQTTSNSMVMCVTV